MDTQNLREAIEIIKSTHTGYAENEYLKNSAFGKAIGIVLDTCQKVLDLQGVMPKKKEGFENKITSVKCRLPEDCLFPNCDCSEPETIIGTIMPTYDKGFNEAIDLCTLAMTGKENLSIDKLQ